MWLLILSFTLFKGMSFARVLYFVLMKDIDRWLPWMLPGFVTVTHSPCTLKMLSSLFCFTSRNYMKMWICTSRKNITRNINRTSANITDRDNNNMKEATDNIFCFAVPVQYNVARTYVNLTTTSLVVWTWRQDVPQSRWVFARWCTRNPSPQRTAVVISPECPATYINGHPCTRLYVRMIWQSTEPTGCLLYGSPAVGPG